jgi:Chaperone of endosialidase
LYYNGALKGTFDHVTGAYTSSSDRRLKKDITQQQPVLNNVMQLQAYQYHYLDNQPTDRFSNGFMAQDVQKIFPDAVVENTMKNGETRLGINYQYFTVLAIKGLQELADQNAKLAEHVGGQQKIIETQTNNIQQQEERIAKLEAAIKTLRPKN